VYEYRFAGCRIFCCKGDADFQNRLSESALRKFKSICTDFQISYRYADLAKASHTAAAKACQSAGGCHPAGRTD
jgi:hypothetical protein